MAYSATLALTRGLLSAPEHTRLLTLFSRAGLSMDHELFNEETLEKATKAILKTRDGLLRAAVPSPLGSCKFLNDVSYKELFSALRQHKQLVKAYPRQGAGIEAYVDASDTGYTINNRPVDPQMHVHPQKMVSANGNGNGNANANANGAADEGMKVFSDCVMNGVRKEFAVNGY
jgi:3-dehydroquinate synthase